MVIFNLGGIVGSLAFGTLSERIGRRRTLMLASLLSRRTAFCVWPICPDIGSSGTADGGRAIRHLGSYSCLSERVVAGGESRDVSRIRLSAGQSVGVGQCKRAVRVCSEPWPRLRHRHCGRSYGIGALIMVLTSAPLGLAPEPPSRERIASMGDLDRWRVFLAPSIDALANVSLSGADHMQARSCRRYTSRYTVGRRRNDKWNERSSKVVALRRLVTWLGRRNRFR